MEERRNLTVTIQQAREWYNKGGEWKKLALSAYTENEINTMTYLQYADQNAPDRRPLNTKVVENKRDEMRVLTMLHNLAELMNKQRGFRAADATRYFITKKRAGAGSYPNRAIKGFYLAVESHSSAFHPGIAYFYSESDANKALRMLKDDLEQVYLK